MNPTAGIEYLIGNLILYIMLLPVLFAGWLIREIYQSHSMARDSRERDGEPPTVADRISGGFSAALPWLVGGTVALFELIVVAAIIYAILGGD